MSTTTSQYARTETAECPACAQLREMLRICIGTLAPYYARELAQRHSAFSPVSELVAGDVLPRAEKALRIACTCGDTGAH